MPGVSVPPIASKESEFTASKGSRPPAFPPFTQGRPARIYTTEGYRVWLCHLPRFWSLLFPSAGLLKSHREVWRTGRELLAQDPSMLRTLTFPSPQGWGRGCRAALWCLPRPSQQQATPQLVSFPFPAVSLAFLCPGRLVGSFPFPAEADKVFGVLAPLSCAERRAVCKLGSSELPGAPCLPPASLL